MSAGRVRCLLFLVTFLLCQTCKPPVVVAQTETLCILDFHRLGDDQSYDWLKSGLADMMITTMSRVSPYQVVDRKYLRQTLEENKLLSTGFTDLSTALKQGYLVKAELLLLGNFTLQENTLSIQTRLLRLSDQQPLAQATWEGNTKDVLDSPRLLSERLLAGLGKPFDAKLLKGLETQIPQSINVAEAFYRGINAFDNGEYPEALAFYLDGSKNALDFLRLHRAALEMYYLLDQSNHAVVFAEQIAKKFEDKGLFQHAVEFYFAAAEKSRVALGKEAEAAHFLEKVISLANKYEQQSHETTRIKEEVVEELDVLHRRYEKHYENITAVGLFQFSDLHFKIWYKDLSSQLATLAGFLEKGEYWHNNYRTDKYIREPVPELSVFMWKIRALEELAWINAKQGQIDEALSCLKEILDEYQFLNQLSIFSEEELFSDDSRAHHWGQGIKLAAQAMVFDHYRATGKLVNNAQLLEAFKINTAQNNELLRCNIASPDYHEKAASMIKTQKAKYDTFYFAAPDGYEFQSLKIHAITSGELHVAALFPSAQGSPPVITNKSIQALHFYSGKNSGVIPIPKGKELVTVHAWFQPELSFFSCLDYQSFGDCISAKRASAEAKEPLGEFEVQFVLSSKSSSIDDSATSSDKEPAESAGAENGWDESQVIRPAQMKLYSGEPSEDVFAKDWAAFSLNGDIHIFKIENPYLTVEIPVAINTSQREYDPSLVRTSDGRYALFFSRGAERAPKEYFFATTFDFIHWDMPKRVIIDRGCEQWRTTNIVAAAEDYMMLGRSGTVCRSKDLKHWKGVDKLLPETTLPARIIRSKDGKLWIAFQKIVNHTPEHPATNVFSLSYGLYVMSSTDGINWEPPKQIFSAGLWSLAGLWHGARAGEMWFIPLEDGRLILAVQFIETIPEDFPTRWFISSTDGSFREVDSPVHLPGNDPQVECSVKDRRIFCTRDVFDYGELRQIQSLLSVSSKKLYDRLFK